MQKEILSFDLSDEALDKLTLASAATGDNDPFGEVPAELLALISGGETMGPAR